MNTPLKALILLVFPTSLFAQSQAAEWQWRESLRLGAVDGPEALTRVSDLELSRDGKVFIGQPEQSAIAVFGRDGTFNRLLGSEGGGPGEFRRVKRLGWRDSLLTIYDDKQPRLTLLSESGAALETYGVVHQASGANAIAMPPVAALSDGTFLVVPRSVGNTGAGITMFKWDARTDSLWPIAVIRGDVAYAEGTGEVISASIEKPVHGRTIWDVSPSGERVVLIHRPVPTSDAPQEFQVILLDAAGDTVFDRSYPYRPVRVERKRAEAAINARFDDLATQFSERLPISRTKLREELQGWLEIPKYQSPVDQVVLGRDGTIWLRRGSYGEEVAPWVILDYKGNVVGETRLNAAADLWQASQRVVWITELGELDVPYARRLERIP
ncbi:MAG: hypothetical protein LC667_12950 [Thioalkalivibrio sp.]|nr:hypothetical protein [Thioalkalivibrio sp.]